MASADAPTPLPSGEVSLGWLAPFVRWITDLGGTIIAWVGSLGDIALFTLRILSWLFTRLPRKETMLPCFYQVGVLSLPVIALTGTFIGMVLAEQTYPQFRMLRLETRLGAAINMSLVRELGPVLAATMLAGRVGGSMAAELGTMRVTEQIDALTAMGADPVHYLVVPRFLACLFLIPLLTAMADFMGVVGGAFYTVYFLGVDWHHYLYHSQNFIGLFDLFMGIFKSFFFGATIGIIGCHQGFNCAPGAEGVGKAATNAFVHSFVLILLLNLLLGIMLNGIYFALWPEPPTLL